MRQTVVTGSDLMKGKVKTLPEDTGHLQSKVSGTCSSKPVFWTVKRIGWHFFRLRKKYPLGMEKIGKINFHKLKFSVVDLRKVYITHPYPTSSKMILVTVMDNPLRVSNSLTDCKDVCF